MKKNIVIVLIALSFLVNAFFTLSRERKMLGLIDGLVEYNESQTRINKIEEGILEEIVDILERNL